MNDDYGWNWYQHNAIFRLIPLVLRRINQPSTPKHQQSLPDAYAKYSVTCMVRKLFISQDTHTLDTSNALSTLKNVL